MLKPEFNLLIDELPSTVEVDGNSFFVNTDFKYGILFNQCLNDEDISSEEKMIHCIDIGFKDEIPDNILEGFNKLVEFYSCSKLDVIDRSKKKESDDENNDSIVETEYENIENNKVLFDFDVDHILIYSTFMQVYKIDLIDTEMHWYKFIGLLRGVFDENNLTKVLQFRAMKIDPKTSPDMKKYYRNMKKHYEIEKYSSEEKESMKQSLQDEWG